MRACGKCKVRHLMYFDSIWEGEYRFGPKTAEDQKKHKTAVKLATAYFQSLQTYMAGYSGNRYEMTAQISEANFEVTKLLAIQLILYGANRFPSRFLKLPV